MNILNFCLKKPLIIFILSIGLFLGGAFCIKYLPIELVPLPLNNALNVSVNYTGASADTIQNEITSPLVTAIKSVDHVTQITATSKAGQSFLVIQLDTRKPIDVLKAENSVNQAISSARLPTNAGQPVIQETGGRNGLISFYMYSANKTPLQLLNYYQTHLADSLKSIQGVSYINTSTDVSNPAVEIKLNPIKINRYHLSLSEIVSRLKQANQNLPMGSIIQNNQAYSLTLPSQTNSVQQLQNLIISKLKSAKQTTPSFVTLGDIATVSYTDTAIVKNSSSTMNGKNVLGVSLGTGGHANPIYVAHTVEKLLTTIKQNLPPGLHIIIRNSSGQTVHDSIEEVLITIGLTAVLVTLICLAFLGRFKNTLIPIATIPICLSATLIFLLALCFSINLFSLLAMVIAIGLVVDDAIVIVEHITVYLEKGIPLAQAIRKSVKEIALIIVGMTLTLVAVYLPTVFMSGFFALWYTQFTVTLAICVLISGVLALTLSPVMCLYLLSNKAPNPYQVRFHQFFARVIQAYQKSLKFILTHRLACLTMTAALIAAGIYGCLQLPKSILAKDPNLEVTILVTPSNLDTATSLVKKMNQQLNGFLPNDPRIEKRYVQAHIDPDTGKLTGKYELDLRRDSVKQTQVIANLANKYLKQKTTLNAIATAQQFFTFGKDSDLAPVLENPNPKLLLTQAKAVASALKQYPQFARVEVDAPPILPQYEMQIHTKKLARAGISQNTLQSLLTTYLGSDQLTNNIQLDGINSAIYLRVDPKFLHGFNYLQLLTIENNKGQQFPITDFVSFHLKALPTVIQTTNNLPSLNLGIFLNQGYSISNAIPIINEIVSEKAPGSIFQYGDKMKNYHENNSNAIFTLLFGLVAVYLTLAIIFNSLLDPFIILFTVPFSLIGGALSLYLIGGTLNIVSIIALITLVGLITKHGILVVQFTNYARKHKSTVIDALLHATGDRFRPIMMTTLAMTAGSLPLIFAAGLGYEMRVQLGVVLVAGLLVGTLFSLYLVPLVYSLFHKNK